MFKFNGSLIRAGGNAKTVKGDKLGKYITAILYMSPADLAVKKTLCAFADIAGCKKGCLNLAGMGIYSNVQVARANKSKRFRDNTEKFMQDLYNDIVKFVAKCEREKVLAAIRLNGTSDILWERIPVNGFANIFEAFPNVQFYDYTKTHTRKFEALPSNYHITLSYSESNSKYASDILRVAKKHNLSVAVVYRSNIQSAKIANMPIIDGDKTDSRFTDKAGSIIALKAKGSAKKDDSGFVIG